jgi:hypothetical protein
MCSSLGKKNCSRRIYLFFLGVRRCRGQVWGKLRSVRVFSKNCAPLTTLRVSSFFLERWDEVAIEIKNVWLKENEKKCWYNNNLFILLLYVFKIYILPKRISFLLQSFEIYLF